MSGVSGAITIKASDDGTLNGTTPVTLIAAPSFSNVQRRNLLITIQNRDTAIVTVTLRKVSGGGTRQIWKGDLNVGDTLLVDDEIILDDTASSITAVMSGAAATTNPDWTSNWEDESSA